MSLCILPIADDTSSFSGATDVVVVAFGYSSTEKLMNQRSNLNV